MIYKTTMNHGRRKPRKRPRRLNTSPPSDPDDHTHSYNAFEVDWKINDWIGIRVRSRPLPILSTLAGHSSHSKGKHLQERLKSIPFVAPLLQEAETINAQTKNAQTKKDTKQNSDNKDDLNNNPASNTITTKVDTTKTPLCDLDNPRHSTLSKQQHVRYFLLRHKFPNTPSKASLSVQDRTLWKEYQSIMESIQSERILYQQYLQTFREMHSSRFLIGYHNNNNNANSMANKFVHIKSQLRKEYQHRWEKSGMPNIFSKYSQAISLPKDPSDMNLKEDGSMDLLIEPTASNHHRSESISLDLFSSKIVSVPQIVSEEVSNVAKISLHEISSLKGTSLLSSFNPKSYTYACDSSLLLEDQHAHSLAIEHGASVIVSSSALNSLIQIPGKASTRWKIPFTIQSQNDLMKRSNLQQRNTNTRKTISIVEDPLPESCTTRDNLTIGMEHAMIQTLWNHAYQKCPSKPSTNKPTFQYVYTLLNIPHPKHISKTIPILVRSINTIFVSSPNSIDTNNTVPLRHQIQLEYFSERGWEDPTNTQRAIWVLEKLLQPTSHLFLLRINPETGNIMKLDETTIANATSSPTFSLSSHVSPLIHVLFGLQHVPPGKHILSLPSSSHRVSVYTHSNSSTTSSSTSPNEPPQGIQIKQQLQASESVFRSTDALMSCFRMWTWMEMDHPGRIPYTFPIPQDESGMIHDHRVSKLGNHGQW